MNRTISRVLWIVAGVLLIIAGVYCLCNPDVGAAGAFSVYWYCYVDFRYH